MNYNREAIGPWEKFTLEPVAKESDKWSLRGGQNSKYCADEGSKVDTSSASPRLMLNYLNRCVPEEALPSSIVNRPFSSFIQQKSIKNPSKIDEIHREKKNIKIIVQTKEIV